jgi:flagellar basal-body rod protein FlgF
VENALLIGLSRQVALGRELDVVANNVANVNTTGFKADSTVFEEYLMPVARHNRFARTDARLSYVQDRATWQDFSQGPLQQTGNPLDVAIDGDAMLVVQTPNGERYTRNGSLQISNTGQLVTSEGHQVLGQNGPITFQPQDRGVMIGLDGSITVREGAEAITDAQRGRLRIVRFDEMQQLRKDGSSTFSAPNGLAAQPAPAARVHQGSIEKSNVRAVVEMTRMIQVTRNYTQVAGLLQQQGELRRTAIQRLADVPA